MGRKHHLRKIEQTYSDTHKKSSCHVSLRGPSGVGKTSIALHFAQKQNDDECLNAYVKCFSSANRTAHFALSSLFEPILKYLLSLENEVVTQLKNELIEADGAIGPLLRPVLPDIRHLMPSDDILPGEVPIAESAVRFENAFLAFANIISPHLPRILFIVDDIQWCDEASIRSLNNILLNQTLHSYFLISTERINSHSSDVNNQTKEEALLATIIDVEDLSRDDVRAMTALYLNTTVPAVIDAVSDRAWSLAKGNPFFLDRILTLCRDGSLAVGSDKIDNLDNYLDLINLSKSYPTVRGLLTASMSSISETAMTTLSIAACIGHTFSNNDLSQVSVCPPQSTETLEIAVTKGLLVRTASPSGKTDNNINWYRFVHDQIQDAALQELDIEKRESIFYELYHYLLKNKMNVKLAHSDVTSILKLNDIAKLLSIDETVALAKLNLEATNINRQSSAFNESLMHVDVIMALSDESWWETQCVLMVEAHIRAIEILIGMCNFERARNLILELEQHKLNDDNTTKLTQLKISYFIAIGNHTSAINTGNQYLEQWKLQLPTIDLEQCIEAELELANEFFSPKALNDIIEQSQAGSSSPRANPMKIMVDLLVPSDAINARLNMWLAIKLFNTSMKYGYCVSSVKALANFGSTCATLGYIDRGFILGESALKICEAEQNKFIAHKAMFTFYGYLKHWREPLQQTAMSLQSVHDTCLLNGDVAYAALTSGMIGSTVYPYTTNNLTDTIAILENSLHFCEESGASGSLQLTLSALLPLSYLQNPQDMENSSNQFQYKDYSETEFLLQCESDNNEMAICNFRILQSLAYAMEDRLIESEISCNSAFQRCGNLYATFSKGMCFFLRSFTVFATCSSQPLRYSNNKESAQHCLDELENWQKINPHNFSCLYHLAKAEFHLANDANEEALAQYVKSIATAKKAEFHFIHALCHSRIAAYWKDCKSNEYYYREHITHSYLISASIQANRSASYFQDISKLPGNNNLQLNTYNTQDSARITDDLASFIDASATINNETDYGSMVRKMLRLLLDLTHFDTVKLFIRMDNELRMEASQDSATFSLYQSQSESTSADYPLSLFRYVERSRETITATRPAEQSPYSKDAYIRVKKPTSIIVLPVSIQASVNAILYFESERSSDTTTDKLKHSLTILSSLIATSIQNILLYKSISTAVLSKTEMLNETNTTLTQTVAQLEKEVDQLGKLRAFLQPHVAEVITSSDHSELLDSHRKRLSIVFCDLRGFTNYSESEEPEDVFDLLGQYHELLGAIIIDFKATIDHRAGDGLMTFIGDPVDIKDTSEHAVKMAMEMQRQVSTLLKDRSLRAHNLGFGVGIATGYSNIGLIGFSGSYGYSATGRNVNLASRLCDEAKDGEILINRTAYADLNETAYGAEKRSYALKGYNVDTTAYIIKLE